jgi:hypothetical protein
VVDPYRKSEDAAREPRWFIKAAEDEKGPFEKTALASSIRSGAVRATTPVRAEGEHEWRPAGEAFKALIPMSIARSLPRKKRMRRDDHAPSDEWLEQRKRVTVRQMGGGLVLVVAGIGLMLAGVPFALGLVLAGVVYACRALYRWVSA